MKDKLLSIFGTAGVIIYWLISFFICVFPLVMLDLPFWANCVCALLIIGVHAISGVFWVWGLIVTIAGPQNALAIIYYVVFAILFIPYFISIVLETIQWLVFKIRK